MRIVARGMAAALALSFASPLAAQTLLIGNKGEDTVSFVDLKSGREVARLPTGPKPHEIAVSPDGKRAAVVAYGGNTIDIFDVAGVRKLTTIDLGRNRNPHGLAWLRSGRIVVTTEGSDALTVVEPAADGKARVRAIPTGQRGSHMVDATLTSAVVANMKSGTVSLISLYNRTPVRNYPAGEEPEGVARSPVRAQIWVADRKNDVVRVLNPQTGAEIIRFVTGRMPIRVLVSRDGARAYVSNAGSGTISVFDAEALRPLPTITVSGKPEAMQVTLLFSRDQQKLYAAETGTDTIAEIDRGTGKVIRRLAAGRQGDGLGISPVSTRPR